MLLKIVYLLTRWGAATYRRVVGAAARSRCSYPPLAPSGEVAARSVDLVRQ